MKQLMKLVLLLTIAIATAVIAAAQTQTQSQPLGDYARAVKKTKPVSQKSAKTYDNDNIPHSSSLNVVGAPKTESSANSQDGTDGTKGNENAADSSKKSDNLPEVKPGQSTEDREKAVTGWKQRIDEQKSKVDLLSRELDVLQRERQIKQADFYSNTARTVQNPRGFDDEDAKYKQQIADKQKAVDDAKAKLGYMQEQARKEGVPSSARE